MSSRHLLENLMRSWRGMEDAHLKTQAFLARWMYAPKLPDSNIGLVVYTLSICIDPYIYIATYTYRLQIYRHVARQIEIPRYIHHGLVRILINAYIYTYIYIYIFKSSTEHSCWFSRLPMLELSSAGLIVQGLRSNLFGPACPFYCSSPAFGALLACFLLGLVWWCVFNMICLWRVDREELDQPIYYT